MLKFPKNLLIPLFFYLIAFIFDATITTRGITNKLGSEGDPITLWLWSIFGYDSFLLKIIYVVLIFSVSYLFYKKVSKILAVLIPYSLGVGHILGFSTWIFHLNNEFNSSIVNRLHAFLVPYGLFIVSPIIGFFISFIHFKRIKS